MCLDLWPEGSPAGFLPFSDDEYREERAGQRTFQTRPDRNPSKEEEMQSTESRVSCDPVLRRPQCVGAASGEAEVQAGLPGPPRAAGSFFSLKAGGKILDS